VKAIASRVQFAMKSKLLQNQIVCLGGEGESILPTKRKTAGS